jgi:hypothetical protein
MRIVVTKRRKALRLLAGLMALVAVLVAVMPVWFPWALRPLLSSYGLRFEDYDRIDYSRFSLVGVRGAWPSARFEAGRIQAPVPTAWLWQRITRGSRDEPRVTLDDWRLNFVRLPTNRVPTKSTSPNSLFQTLDQIVSADAMLRRGLAVARLNNGVVETRFERIAIPLITWSGGKIEATLRPSQSPRQFP